MSGISCNGQTEGATTKPGWVTSPGIIHVLDYNKKETVHSIILQN